MQVETFECEETATESVEQSAEAIALIESLGLKGQRKLVGGGNDGDGVAVRPARCPYRQMTAEEQFVYRTLCPSSTILENYDAGPIPLRVLQVASHAQQLGVFRELRVWHVASPAVKDPVLVGVEGNWPVKFYILARWGEALDEWPAMVKQSLAAFKDNVRDALTSIRKQVALDLDDVDNLTFAAAVKANGGLPSYSSSVAATPF